MYRKGIHGSSTGFVLNGLSYGIAHLFDSFVLSQSMIEGTTSMTKGLNQAGLMAKCPQNLGKSPGDKEAKMAIEKCFVY